MKLRNLIVVSLICLFLATTLPAGSWLHVRVESENNEKVRVNIPLELVNTVLPILEEKGMGPFEHGHGMDWNHHDMSVSDLRKIWAAVKAQGSYELADVENEEMNVRVFIEGNYFRVESREGSKALVDVKLPMQVVDALLSGEGEQLNLTAAIEALQDAGEQALVTVEAEDARVRVWIDDKNNG